MPLLKTPAITLRSRKWGEADRIVTFYTLRLGKVRGIARGARRLKSRFGAALEPFVSCDLNLFEKAGDSLFRISQVDMREPFTKLREDLTRMSAAARMVNLVAAITPEGDPEPRIFDTLADGLRSLEDSRDAPLTALLFQIRLLGLTGFKPQLDQCSACGNTRLAGEPQFSPTSGGLICSLCARRQALRCLPLSPGSLAFMRQALRWAPAVVDRLRATGRIRAELETAIESYVTTVAGKRLPPIDFLAAEGSSTYGPPR
ncbi:MAG: DNA repair protein RecO [Nitrospirota bacterium]